MSIELVLGALRDASSQDHLRIKAAAEQLKQWEVKLIKQALFSEVWFCSPGAVRRLYG